MRARIPAGVGCARHRQRQHANARNGRTVAIGTRNEHRINPEHFWRKNGGIGDAGSGVDARVRRAWNIAGCCIWGFHQRAVGAHGHAACGWFNAGVIHDCIAVNRARNGGPACIGLTVNVMVGAVRTSAAGSL